MEPIDQDTGNTWVRAEMPRGAASIMLVTSNPQVLGVLEAEFAAEEISNPVINASPTRAHHDLLEILRAGEGRRIPGVVFLDGTSPNAWECLHELRTDSRTMCLPVIVLIDSLAEEQLQISLHHGVTGYFLLPPDGGQLKKVIKDVEQHLQIIHSASEPFALNNSFLPKWRETGFGWHRA